MRRILDKIKSKNLTPLVIIYYLVGLAGLIIPFTRSLFQSLTPFSLLMSVTLVYLFHDRFSARFWLLSAIILILGIGVEMVGVKTGILFGEYTYGDTLGFKIMHTPLIIGLNWLMLVYCSLSIVGKFIDSKYFRALGAAALMVVYDFALEPAANHLDMWSWTGTAVPLQNYLAWFLISFCLNYLANLFRLPASENKMAMPLFFIQLGFFIALDIWIFAEKIWVLS